MSSSISNDTTRTPNETTHLINKNEDTCLCNLALLTCNIANTVIGTLIGIFISYSTANAFIENKAMDTIITIFGGCAGFALSRKYFIYPFPCIEKKEIINV
ncbi:MAG: hypothetical protein KR126chlam6_00555 [Candidatus Anoxychlamydiales bacterium]|nr:hypothetical protein [Candidatus Anoxychlamydiales bacterium]